MMEKIVDLEHAEYSHDPDQPEHFAHSAHHQSILHALQDKAKDIWQNGKQINDI